MGPRNNAKLEFVLNLTSIGLIRPTVVIVDLKAWIDAFSSRLSSESRINTGAQGKSSLLQDSTSLWPDSGNRSYFAIILLFSASWFLKRLAIEDMRCNA